MKPPKEYYRDDYQIQTKVTLLNHRMYRHIASFSDVETIFEFGCNCGKNLGQLHKLGKYILHGRDISQRAINYGSGKYSKLLNIDLSLGNELSLDSMPDDAYDLVFTCSVVCHIPDADKVIKNLIRIAKKHVVLMETNDSHIKYWYQYNYDSYGFTPVFEEYSPAVKCLYKCYYLKK